MVFTVSSNPKLSMVFKHQWQRQLEFFRGWTAFICLLVFNKPKQVNQMWLCKHVHYESHSHRYFALVVTGEINVKEFLWKIINYLQKNALFSPTSHLFSSKHYLFFPVAFLECEQLRAIPLSSYTHISPSCWKHLMTWEKTALTF